MSLSGKVRDGLLASGIVIAVLVLPGCTSCELGSGRDFEIPLGIPLAPGVVEEARPDDLRWVQGLPIVDIHVHTFNARYLPLEHILLGKRDAHFLGIFLTDRTAIRIARETTRAAPLTPLERVSLPPLPGDLTPGPAQQRLRAGFDRICARCNGAQIPNPELITEEEEHAVEQFREILGPVLGLALSSQTARRFLGRLLSEDGRTKDLFQTAFRQEGQVDPRVDLLVSHAMDLAPTYDQLGRPETGLLDYQTQQLPRMAAHQNSPRSRMIWFVGYNPFRPKDHGEDHLHTVRTAVRKHGAYGIKVYPPDGYRPSLNRIPGRPWTLFASQPELYWDSRYEVASGHGDADRNDGVGVDAAELDRRLLDLARYAAEHDLPIFVHTGHGEFEARKGYGECLANPDFWIPVLEKYPKLRLCLGHAGGQEYWFGTEDEFLSWGRRCAELCMNYERVYCGFGVHDGFAQGTRHFDHFVKRLEGLFAHPDANYPLAEKILYGSDWFMPRSGKSERFILDEFQRAFATSYLAPHAPRFFATNALEFLDVESRIRRRGWRDDARLPDLLRERLRHTLKRIRERLTPRP